MVNVGDKSHMIRSLLALSVCLLGFPSGVSAQGCTGGPVAVQVLGSGGPAVNSERASTSYLLWIDGQSKALVDIGGGAFLRFGQARAKISDLSLVMISHLHPDHVSDLPALLWLSHRDRTAPLPIVGPSGNDVAPAFPVFLTRLFDEKNGAFQVLGPTVGGVQGGSGGGVPLDVRVVDVSNGEVKTVFDQQGITVTALGIPHGNLPTAAYRVQTRGMSIVFSSDQTGTNPRFVDFARGANLMIMHLAIPAGATNPVHAAPDVVGRIAQEAGVGRLLVSHLGLVGLDGAIDQLKRAFKGPLTVGADLQCTSVR